MREKCLLVGEPNSSKTLSLLSLAVIYPQSKVVIFDPDDGTEKVVAELGLDDLDNLTVLPVDPDWEKFIAQYQQVRSVLAAGDWLCLDMLGRFWDKAQEYYSSYVFGSSPIEHLMNLKKQAKSTSFGGFDGLTDWTIIKRLHNEQLLDDAVLRAPFNVMATTSTANLLPIQKAPKAGTIEGIYQAEFGVKPEGEKHNIYRFDGQAVMYRKKEGTYHFRLMRDRGRPVDVKKEYDITGKSFWEVYREMRREQGIAIA